jgi:hypothetical protein
MIWLFATKARSKQNNSIGEDILSSKKVFILEEVYVGAVYGNYLNKIELARLFQTGINKIPQGR